ncbi:hypothetical protein ANANG_G00258410, partial [Anguilla anguilla]
GQSVTLLGHRLSGGRENHSSSRLLLTLRAWFGCAWLTPIVQRDGNTVATKHTTVMSGRGQYKPTSFILFICNRSFKVMSVKMETDVGGVSRAPVMVLPAAEPLAGLRAEPERPRCSSTPCSPVRSGVAGYQIVHMDCNYLVGFTTGRSF